MAGLNLADPNAPAALTGFADTFKHHLVVATGN
jgi:hypothetical protein